jgi:undecaprenyl-diphosphatase
MGSPPGSARFRITRFWPYLTVAALLGGFAALTVAVCLGGRPYFGWDVAVTRALQAVPWPGLETLMRVISLAGDNLLWSTLLVVAACAVLLAAGDRRAAVVLLAVVAVGQVCKIAAKDTVARPRPDAETVHVFLRHEEIHEHLSFPSGHTVHYTVLFGFLWFIAFTRLKPRVLRWPVLGVLGAVVLLVGPARIYLGAHWASDVLGGYLLGAAVLVAGICLYRRWMSRAPAAP